MEVVKFLSYKRSHLAFANTCSDIWFTMTIVINITCHLSAKKWLFISGNKKTSQKSIRCSRENQIKQYPKPFRVLPNTAKFAGPKVNVDEAAILICRHICCQLVMIKNIRNLISLPETNKANTINPELARPLIGDPIPHQRLPNHFLTNHYISVGLTAVSPGPEST